MTTNMIIFTNDELGISEKNYFSKNNTKIFLKEKDISLDEMREYHSLMLQQGSSEEDLLYFIDDKATSIIDNEKMEQVDQYVKILLQDVDIFYMANFMDNCKVMKPISSFLPDNLKNFRFYHSLAPNGFYATVTTFKKWSEIFEKLENKREAKISSKLSSLVLEHHVKAGTVWPRIFVPNINKLTSDIDNFYTYPCRIERNFVNSDKKETQELSMFWFVLGVSMVFVAFLIMTKVWDVRELRSKFS